MKCNVGKIDRILRLILGIILLILAILLKKWWLLIGLLPLITGVIKFCPLYAILKIDTCKRIK